MIRRFFVLSVAVASFGCSLPSGPGPTDQMQAASAPVEPLAGIEFKPVTAENARYATGGMAVSAPTAVAPMPAPMMAPSPSVISRGGVVSGNVYGGTPYGYYGGMGDPSHAPMALVSMTQGQAPGSRGPLNQILESVVAPVLKDWAPDARLVSSSAMLGSDGLLPASPDPNYGQAGWQLNYVAPSRQEALSFMVQPDKTLVIRQRWAPVDLAAAPVTLDADAAVGKLTAAIEDQGFQSEEEKTGVDYFVGTTTVSTPPPVPPAPGPGYESGHVEVIYDVPDDARWHADLQTILGRRVWHLSYFVAPERRIKPMPAPMPKPAPSMTPPSSTQGPMPTPMATENPDFYFNNSARGMVDADTGTVIRFTRPSKNYFPKPMGPIPPRPSEMPSVAPSP